MNAQLEQIEVETASINNDNFAVEDASIGQLREQIGDEFGEIAIEGLEIAALKQNLIAVTKNERAKAVPLGLEGPMVTDWQFAHTFSEHRRNRRRNNELHG